MGYKVLELECIRCGHTWKTRPTMVKNSKDGVPRSCPKCHKFLLTKNLKSYRILGVIDEWGGDLKQVSENEISKFKKTRKKKPVDENAISFKPKQSKPLKLPSDDIVSFDFGGRSKSKKTDKDLDTIMGW